MLFSTRATLQRSPRDVLVGGSTPRRAALLSVVVAAALGASRAVADNAHADRAAARIAAPDAPEDPGADPEGGREPDADPVTPAVRGRPWDWEVGGTVGYLSGPIRGAVSPFGVGLGGRFGVVVSGVYVGVSLTDYLGGSDVDLSDRALVYGLEGGYELRLRRFDGGGYVGLRGQVGLGDAAVSHTDPSLAKVDVVTSASGNRSSSSTSDTLTVHSLYVQPGLRAVLASRWGFASLGASTLVLPRISYGGSSSAATWMSYGLDSYLGLRF